MMEEDEPASSEVRFGIFVYPLILLAALAVMTLLCEVILK